MLKPDDSPPASIESPVDRSPQIAGLVVPVALKHDPYAAFRSRGYTLFTIGNLLSVIGRQMLAVAVGGSCEPQKNHLGVFDSHRHYIRSAGARFLATSRHPAGPNIAMVQSRIGVDRRRV